MQVTIGQRARWVKPGHRGDSSTVNGIKLESGKPYTGTVTRLWEPIQ